MTWCCVFARTVAFLLRPAISMAELEPDAQESDARLSDLLCRWSSPTLKHRHDDLQLLCSAVEVAKAFLRQDAEKFVRDLEGRPVLLQYSGDGTPIKYKWSITARSGEESLRRSEEHRNTTFRLAFWWHSMPLVFVRARCCWRTLGR